MATEYFEQYMNMGKNFLNPLNNAGKGLIDIYRHAGQEALEITQENLARAADQVKRCGSVKRPDEWLSLSKELATENLNAWMSNVQKCQNIMVSTAEEINKSLNINLKDQHSSVGSGSARTTERTK